MLRAVLHIGMSLHVTNTIQNEGTPSVSGKTAVRKMRLDRTRVSKLAQSLGRPTLTYVDVLKEDTGVLECWEEVEAPGWNTGESTGFQPTTCHLQRANPDFESRVFIHWR